LPTTTKRQLIGSRAHQRFPTAFEATIVHRRGSYPVHVEDVSVRGARVRLVHRLAQSLVGSHVVLRMNALDVEATIVWQADERCGLLLREDIAPLSVVRENYAPLHHLRRRTAPVPGRPNASVSANVGANVAAVGA